MKISFRPTKLLLPLLLAFSSEELFYGFVFTSPDEPALRYVGMAQLILGLVAALWYWRYMEKTVLIFLFFNLVYLCSLMLESYADYGVWMMYIHVFWKVLAFFVVFGIYGYYRCHGLPSLRPLAVILLGLFVLHLVIIHPEALNLHAFLNHDRGVSGTTALTLVLPTVVFLNWYLATGKRLPMLLFFASLAIIIFVQHRSVWVMFLTALLLNLLLLWRRGGTFRFKLSRVVMLVWLPMVVGIGGGLATILTNPQVIKKFEDNYEDIIHADKQGTGNWRLLQTEAYKPRIAERPVLGWRLEGFELPIQFYDPSSNEPMWASGTGHHFHSFYLTQLFYFGWLGLLLLLTLPFMQFIKRVLYPAALSPDTIALLSFLASCLVFGLSYDWPIFLYALLGLGLAASAAPQRQARPLSLSSEVAQAQLELIAS